MNEQVFDIFQQELKGRLGTQLKQLILFGSKARGDDSPYSDCDLLAVVDRVSPEIEETIDQLSGDFLYEHNVVFSVIAISEERHVQQIYNPLLMNIRREGVAL